MAEFIWSKQRTSCAPADETSAESRQSPQKTAENTVYMLKTDEIRPNPSQPRRHFAPEAIAALADSIRRYGIIQPLTVRKTDVGGGTYELIAGERRLRAALSIGLTAVPCVLLAADEAQSAALAIIENIQRENLNMFEQAAAFSSLIRLHDLTQDEIAARLSVSQSYVANKLRLLRYLPDEREEILAARLTERHARTLLRLSGDDRMTALKRVIAEHMNVAETEAYVESLLESPDEAPPTPKTPPKPEIPRNRPAILKDVRLFCNSLNRAIDIMRQAGVDATTVKHETEDGTEIRVFIPRVSRETTTNP